MKQYRALSVALGLFVASAASSVQAQIDSDPLLLSGQKSSQAQCGSFNQSAKGGSMRVSLVQTYTSCFLPNALTFGVPGCSPPVPAQLSEFLISSLHQAPLPIGPTEYEFEGPSSGCSLIVTKPKLESPCSSGSGVPCTNAKVRLTCKGIVDGSGNPPEIGSGLPFMLGIVLRSTVRQSTGDMTVVDTPLEVWAPVFKDGIIRLKTDLAEMVDTSFGNHPRKHVIAACVSNEIIEVVLLDPTGRPFAVPGVASPEWRCHAAIGNPDKTTGIRVPMVRHYTSCPTPWSSCYNQPPFVAPNALTDEGAAACGLPEAARMEDVPASFYYPIFSRPGGPCYDFFGNQLDFCPLSGAPGPFCDIDLSGASEYSFSATRSGCLLKIAKPRLEDPCSNELYDGPCTNAKVKLSCKGIVDSTGTPIGPLHRGWQLIVHSRSSIRGEFGVAITVLQWPFFSVGSTPKNGSFAISGTLSDADMGYFGAGAQVLSSTCGSHEFAFELLDPKARPFANALGNL
jgi:hypothetical protein